MSSRTQAQGSARLSVHRTRRGAARVLVTFEIAGRGPVVHFGPEYPTEAQALDSLPAHMDQILAAMDRLGLKHD